MKGNDRCWPVFVLAVWIASLVTACWVDTTPPAGTNPGCLPVKNCKPGEPCGTSGCDQSESFWNCPNDCRACLVNWVSASTNVTLPEQVVGPSDGYDPSKKKECGIQGKCAKLGPQSILDVFMGGGIFTGVDTGSDSWDFEVRGTVTSNGGSFAVQLMDGDNTVASYRDVGSWFQGTDARSRRFDLKFAKITKSDNYHIRLIGQGNSTAEVDAIVVNPNSCLTQIGGGTATP